jgi:hypothetical protein
MFGQTSKSISTKSADLKIVKTDDNFLISLKNSSYLDIVGQPAVPVYIKSFVIPVNAKATGIKIKNVKKQKIAGKFYIEPAQPPVPVSDKDDSIQQTGLPDMTVYNSSSPYPNKNAEIIAEHYDYGYHTVTVRFFPIEYIPKTNEIYLCDIDYEIEYTLVDIKSESDKIISPYQTRYMYELNKSAVKAIIENPEDIEKYSPQVQIVQEKNIETTNSSILNLAQISVLNERVPNYIIITCDSLKTAFQQLANWKTKKGVFTVIQTVETIDTLFQGSDLQEKIRNYLKDAHSKWGTLFVLLGGDTNIVPARMIKGIDELRPSDLYYATIGGSWNANNNNIFGESNDKRDHSYAFVLGRVPVKNTTETKNFINKILNYEKAAGITNNSYYNNVLISDAFILRCPALNYRDVVAHYGLKSYATNNFPSYVNSWLMFDNADCSGSLYNYSGGTYSCKDENSAVYSPAGTCISGNEEFSRNNFLAALRNGGNSGLGYFHIVYHMDHSGETGMATSGKDKGERINRDDFDNLTNGNYYQILMTGGCKPATFTYDCMAEHYLNNPNGGGVAFIGNADYGYSNEHSQFDAFMKALYAKNGRYDIGYAFHQAPQDDSQRRRLMLLGDPEMQVWTDAPKTLSVTTTPVILISSGSATLSVTISGLSLPAGETALICVQKGTEVYETKMVSGNGTYNFPLNIATTGALSVTVTAHNYKPVEKTVQAFTKSGPNLAVESVNFANIQNNAGDRCIMTVTVKNNGSTAANGVTAKLSCNSNLIRVASSPLNLGNIANGDSARAHFYYEIHPLMPETLSNSQNPVTFTLLFTSSEGTTWTKSFNIDVFATELQQRNKIIVTPANGNIGANTNVTFNIELQNIGRAPATELTAVLKSNNATCPTTTVNYPIIGYMQTKTASSNFQFTTNTVTNPDFTLEVTNAYGKKWTFPFNLTKPDTVTGFKAFGKERAIDLLWNAVSGAVGYNIYRCNVGANNAESGSYVKMNNLPVTFLFFNDDNGLNILTKYYYRVTAVSSTGMESSPVRLLTWTSYPTKGMFPVTMGALSGTNIESHFAAEDINNDGKKEIFTSLAGGDSGGIGDIIALDWEGNELFDIDNNVTTCSGFAQLGKSVRASIAIADINNDGVKEIISLTRGFENNKQNNLITCHIASDRNSDQKPDILWQKQIQRTFWHGAIVANLDNSSDGSMEILTVPCGNSPYHTPQIYSAQGNLIREIPLNKSTYSTAAVADLDGDGDMEIIIGFPDGIYVWHHDGMPFTSNPFYSLSGYNLMSSPVVCDLDNDGIKEILVSVFKTTAYDACRILALKPNGQLLSGWGASGGANQYTSVYGDLTKEIAVGDLNGDGNLEVVAVGNDCIKIWNRNGTLYNTISLPNSGIQSCKRVPLLADIDGDPEIEIIVTSASDGKIYGYKHNGNSVLGFPLETAQPFGNSTPVIADLDGNGKSEIVAGTGMDKKVYVWETNGDPTRIEWGSARHNSQNTGEYVNCRPKIIQSNTTWSTGRSICGDITVQSGTLTISNNARITMDSSSTITVQSGATLYLNSGNLLNCNMKVMPGANLIMQNNAQIKLRGSATWDIQAGATFDMQSGSINY